MVIGVEACKSWRENRCVSEQEMLTINTTKNGNNDDFIYEDGLLLISIYKMQPKQAVSGYINRINMDKITSCLPVQGSK